MKTERTCPLFNTHSAVPPPIVARRHGGPPIARLCVIGLGETVVHFFLKQFNYCMQMQKPRPPMAPPHAPKAKPHAPNTAPDTSTRYHRPSPSPLPTSQAVKPPTNPDRRLARRPVDGRAFVRARRTTVEAALPRASRAKNSRLPRSSTTV